MLAIYLASTVPSAGIKRIMSKVATFILKVAGTKETGVIPVVSGAVAIISSFMQDVGAVALFLPVLGRISKRASIRHIPDVRYGSHRVVLPCRHY
ncbi:MAG TPA: hypothetical protein EYH35_04930 [Thiotrichaceae bacterium]|nr:hypothetical protein [Thiotrichaceae bacterium]